MRTSRLLAILAIAPGLLLAQEQPPIDRLRAVLPADVADRIIALATDATRRGLPGQAIAERALEASARGRNARVASSAAEAFARDLAETRDAMRRAGRTPDVSEVEAAATARELGVDGATISALASQAPSGRSLAVPLAVIGTLVNRGLPSADALKAVLARLQADASDANLLAMPGEEGRGLGEGYKSGDVGRALSAAGRPLGVPVNGGHAGARPHTTHP